MPATSRYPWETDDVFKQRMMGQNPQAFGVPPVPMAQPQAGNIAGGMLGGMGPKADERGPSPMGIPPSPMQGPPSPMGPETLGQGPPSPPAPLPQFGPLAGGYGQATPGNDAMLDDLTSINMDVQAEKGLVDQLEQARALRDTASPEGRHAGRTFVAANPLEFLGAGIKQYKGGKKAKETEAELEKNRAEQGRKEGGITRAVVKEKRGWGDFFKRDDDKK